MKINSCLLFALLVLLVSYTLAVETSQQATTTENANGDADTYKVGAYGGGGGGNYGGGGGNYGGGGGNYGGGGPWGCRHGCCYKRGYGGCSRCCSSPEEAKAYAEKQVRP